MIKIEKDYVDDCEYCVCYICDKEIVGDCISINNNLYTMNICKNCKEAIGNFESEL